MEILENEEDMIEKVVEYVSKLKEMKKKKVRIIQDPVIDYKQIQSNFDTYNATLNSFKEILNKVNQENIYLKQELQEQRNKEYISLKKDNQELKELISLIKKEILEIKQSILDKKQLQLKEKNPPNKKEDQKVNNQCCIIQGLQHELQIEKIHSSTLNSFLLLRDKRIVTCSSDNSISVISIDFNKKIYVQDIKKEKAHSNEVNSLCELDNNKLVSGSWDKNIKIWEITKNDLTLLSTLNNHTDHVYRVINLTHNRFASCSEDKTVKIWSTNSPYQEITSLIHNGSVYDLFQLKHKEILVTSNNGNNCLEFWNLSNYQKMNSIKGLHSSRQAQGIIELSNNLLAVSSCASNSIVIVDPNKYVIIKEIKESKYMTTFSSLCLLNSFSFIYVYQGNVLQISISDNYSIIYKTNAEKQLYGYRGIISIEDGKYLVIHNQSNGLSIISPYYLDKPN